MGTSVTVMGIVLVCISILAFIGGVLLLIFGILSTIKGKKRIGRIVIGAILLFNGLVMSIVTGMLTVVAGGIETDMNDKSSTYSLAHIEAAFYNKNPEMLAMALAETGYSGDAIEQKNAKELIESIEGNVIRVKYNSNGIEFHNSTRSATYEFRVTTTEKQYIVYMNIITSASNKNYMGIQHIRMSEDGETLFDFGTKPVLN